MSLALYRKYRPTTFAEVVGQEHVTGPLRTALAAGRINHAYLFSGPRGCGKTSSARILARSLNCTQGPTPDPCGVCSSCIALAPEGPGSLDVVELDAASHGGVEDTRELRDRAFYMPAESRYRVFIIDEAHMVTSQGFNALLKIVEEPPDHLVFVFATTEPEKVLPTIRSRTHHYPFHLLPPVVLRGLLEKLCAQEGVTVEPAVFPLVVRAGAGSARDALSVLDQLLAGAGPEGVRYADAVSLLGVTDAALLDDMVEALEASDSANVFGAIEKMVSTGLDPRRFAADLLERLRDLVILQAVPGAAESGIIDVPDDELATMASQAQRLPMGTLTRFAEILHEGLNSMRGTTSPRLVLELLAARMLLPEAAAGSAEILQRVERLELRIDIATPTIEPRQESDHADDVNNRAPVAHPAPAAPPPPEPAPAPVAEQRTPQSTEQPAEHPAATPSSNLLGLPTPPVLSTDREPGPAAAPASPEPKAAAPQDVIPDTEPAAAASDLNVADVRRLWRDILSAVQAKRRSTQILLEGATVVGADAGTLELSMATDGLARQVMEGRNVDVLRLALGEVLGVDWRVRCTAGEGGGPAAPAADRDSVSDPAPDRVAPDNVPAPAPAQPARADGADPDTDIVTDSDETFDPTERAAQLLKEQLGARPIDPDEYQ